MNHFLVVFFSYSIVLAAIIGLIRFNKLDKAYIPFILLVWAGLFNEIISTVSINLLRSNAVNSNIYVLLEAMLILWFFKNLKLFEKRKNLFYLIAFFYILLWVTDNFYFSSITQFSSYFGIGYSIITVLMSTQVINKLFLEEKARLNKNAVFVIMIGFIVFFTYKALIEIFWVYGLNASTSFRLQVYRIMSYINLSVNLMFALAILWIPRKREYTLL